MMSDWGVHLNDIVLWALNAKGPKSVCTTGGILTSDDNRDTPDTMQVVYEFPECVLTYSMRKGNGLKFNGHDYGILFCGTDGSLMLDRSGFEVIPDKTVLPYGIKLVHGDRPIRKIDLKPEKAKGVDGQDAHVRNFLDCVKIAGPAHLRHRDRPPFHQHLPPGQHLLQARPQAGVGHRYRVASRTTRRPMRSSSANPARAMSCRRSDGVQGPPVIPREYRSS